MARIVGRLLGGVVVALGLAALVGWALERRALTELGFGSSSLKVNTALCFVALGTAVLLRGTERQRLRTVLEAAAGVVAVAMLVENVRGASVGIDEPLFDDPFAPGERRRAHVARHRAGADGRRAARPGQPVLASST